MELFLFIILVILVIGGFVSYWVWCLTKGLFIVFRFIFVVLLIAFIIILSVIVGHGVVIVLVIFIVIDSIAFGKLREFYEGVVILVGVVAGVVYGILLLVVFIRYLILRRKVKNVVEQNSLH